MLARNKTIIIISTLFFTLLNSSVESSQIIFTYKCPISNPTVIKPIGIGKEKVLFIVKDENKNCYLYRTHRFLKSKLELLGQLPFKYQYNSGFIDQNDPNIIYLVCRNNSYYAVKICCIGNQCAVKETILIKGFHFSTVKNGHCTIFRNNKVMHLISNKGYEKFVLPENYLSETQFYWARIFSPQAKSITVADNKNYHFKRLVTVNGKLILKKIPYPEQHKEFDILIVAENGEFLCTNHDTVIKSNGYGTVYHYYKNKFHRLAEGKKFLYKQDKFSNYWPNKLQCYGNSFLLVDSENNYSMYNLKTRKINQVCPEIQLDYFHFCPGAISIFDMRKNLPYAVNKIYPDVYLQFEKNNKHTTIESLILAHPEIEDTNDILAPLNTNLAHSRIKHYDGNLTFCGSIRKKASNNNKMENYIYIMNYCTHEQLNVPVACINPQIEKICNDGKTVFISSNQRSKYFIVEDGLCQKLEGNMKEYSVLDISSDAHALLLFHIQSKDFYYYHLVSDVAVRICKNTQKISYQPIKFSHNRSCILGSYTVNSEKPYTAPCFWRIGLMCFKLSALPQQRGSKMSLLDNSSCNDNILTGYIVKDGHELKNNKENNCQKETNTLKFRIWPLVYNVKENQIITKEKGCKNANINFLSQNENLSCGKYNSQPALFDFSKSEINVTILPHYEKIETNSVIIGEATFMTPNAKILSGWVEKDQKPVCAIWLKKKKNYMCYSVKEILQLTHTALKRKWKITKIHWMNENGTMLLVDAKIGEKKWPWKIRLNKPLPFDK